MKKYLTIFIPAVLLVLAAISYIEVVNGNLRKQGNQTQSVQTVNIAGEKDDACCKVDEGTASHSDKSIYQLNSVWEDQDGNSVELKKFTGKKVVLALIYTYCPTVCPVIVNNMQKLETAIPRKELNNYRFVLISIDPQRDTPSRLKQYAVEKQLDMRRWTLLTGSNNNVAELAELIGFRYKKNSNGNFVHSNLITFLDKDGVIKSQSEGLEQSSQVLLSMLNK